MDIVKRYSDKYARLIPNQVLESGIRYVAHPFVINEGNLYYNTLTGEVARIEDLDKDKEVMALRWFYVPEGTNHRTLAMMSRQTVLSSKTEVRDNVYTIFTTTKCNGKCKYCFQSDIERTDMDEQTALDVAKYIQAHRNVNAEVHLRWFGGEPLVNKDVITTICNYLRHNNVAFRSSMSSNGDLFSKVSNEEIYLWNLKSVQFTIDLPDDEYDEEKGLPEGSYERLKATVERLSSLFVSVVIRVHFNKSRSFDVYKKIIDDFKDYSMVSMYSAMLYGEELAINDYKNLMHLEDLMVECGKLDPSIPDLRIGMYCMADSKVPSCISTDGSFTPCEHHAFGESYGSIYSDTYDVSILNKWMTKTRNVKQCSKCPLLPTCELLSNCPTTGECDEGYQYYQIERIKRALRRI